jgi:hypothetical protein
MADGGPVIQGQPGWGTNTTATPTQLVNASTSGNGTGLYLFAGSSGPSLYTVGRQGTGVTSYSYGSHGVIGVAIPAAAGGADGPFGVYGFASLTGGRGVYGQASIGVWGDGTIGMVGRSQADYGIAMEADALGENSIGVFGYTAASSGGIGVYATAPSPDSNALQVQGRAVFSASGKLTVPAGAAQVTHSPGGLKSGSLILATLQQNRPGVSVRAAVPNVAAGSFTIHFTQAVPADTTVAWFVVN